jgi:phosphoribosyl 1,2-cyclic phosphate phosphodiesterase
MKIKFLGTGGVFGVPMWNCDCEVCKSKDSKDKRLRPALFVQIEDKNIAIDFGPDFRQQLIKNKIKKLDYAFLTHAHGDHMNGVAELVLQKDLILESPKEVLDDFFERMGSAKRWMQTRNPSIQIKPFKKKKICDITIDTIKSKHQKDYVKNEVPCFGFLFKSKNFSFAYLSDYNEVLEPEKIENLDLLISDGCGFENAMPGHTGIKGSIEIYNKFKPKKMLITHIKHSKTHKDLNEHLKKFGNIECAYDGMEINVEILL